MTSGRLPWAITAGLLGLSSTVLALGVVLCRGFRCGVDMVAMQAMLFTTGSAFEAAEAAGRGLTILYPIDRGRDTLESLRDFVEGVVHEKQHPDRRIVVLKNLFFGQSERFKRFDAWANAHKPASMTVASWPELNELIVDKLADQRATLDRSELLTLMERTVLKKYQRDIIDIMTEIGVIDG